MAESGKNEAISDAYRPIEQQGAEQVRRSSLDLGVSGLIAGLDIGFGPVAMAVVAGRIHDLFHVSMQPALFLGSLLYPLGFVFVIMGKSELFTENTLAPVAGVLARASSVGELAREWSIILLANIVGLILFSLLVAHVDVLFTPYKAEYAAMGTELMHHSFLQIAAAGLFAGWLVALIGWLIETTRGSIVHFFEIYTIAYLLVGLGLPHCIIGSIEVLLGMFAGGPITWGSWLLAFLVPSVIGNAIGGAFFVTSLKGFQAALNARSQTG